MVSLSLLRSNCIDLNNISSSLQAPTPINVGLAYNKWIIVIRWST